MAVDLIPPQPQVVLSALEEFLLLHDDHPKPLLFASLPNRVAKEFAFCAVYHRMRCERRLQRSLGPAGGKEKTSASNFNFGRDTLLQQRIHSL